MLERRRADQGLPVLARFEPEYEQGLPAYESNLKKSFPRPNLFGPPFVSTCGTHTAYLWRRHRSMLFFCGCPTGAFWYV